MAEVKWIKIVTGIFDDEKVQLIEQMPEGDTILVVWFKILCLAGKTNNSGIIMLSDKIPYTDEMLAAIFRRPLNTVRLALNTFEAYGMIEIVDGVVTITNWEKHQNDAKLESIREYNKLAKQKERQRKKALLCQGNVNDSQDTDIDIDIDIEEDKRYTGGGCKPAPRPPKTDFSFYQSTYNSVCANLPKCKLMTEKREKAVRSFEKQLGKDRFPEICEKANASAFCTGGNDRGWKADFNFLIRPDKAANILEGKYDDQGGVNNGSIKNPADGAGELKKKWNLKSAFDE